LQLTEDHCGEPGTDPRGMAEGGPILLLSCHASRLEVGLEG